jgi:hypothetical protein
MLNIDRAIIKEIPSNKLPLKFNNPKQNSTKTTVTIERNIVSASLRLSNTAYADPIDISKTLAVRILTNLTTP